MGLKVDKEYDCLKKELLKEYASKFKDEFNKMGKKEFDTYVEQQMEKNIKSFKENAKNICNQYIEFYAW